MNHKLPSDVCQFLIDSEDVSSDIEDPYYCVVRALPNVDQQYRLLIDPEPNPVNQFKMLWQFSRSDRRMKQKMINQLHRGRNREITAWIGIMRTRHFMDETLTTKCSQTRWVKVTCSFPL